MISHFFLSAALVKAKASFFVLVVVNPDIINSRIYHVFFNAKIQNKLTAMFCGIVIWQVSVLLLKLSFNMSAAFSVVTDIVLFSALGEL